MQEANAFGNTRPVVSVTSIPSADYAELIRQNTLMRAAMLRAVNIATRGQTAFARTILRNIVSTLEAGLR